jgi:DNA helicase-2/ATP-dependent DNA helicase PcrA
MGLEYKNLLNEKQNQAVHAIDGPVLILAGAGSGKTRVITYRIAYLLEQGIPQSSILAVTFTNKAAREMSERIRQIVRKRLSNLTISTFHSFGVTILREQIGLLGYRKNFSIYDEQDQLQLIKECGRELGINRDSLDAYKIASIFSGIKIKRFTWNAYNDQYRELFDEYEQHLKLYNAVDFDDLIILPIEILTQFPEVLDAYQAQFKYFMVDEFQDTSTMQYEYIKKLAWKSKKICVVGDDDQSIYSWRGANYENILMFEHDFPDYTEIKLEQNYRSTKNILVAANALISNNKNRKSKNLWTGTSGGEKIQLYLLENEKKEGELIADKIKSLRIRQSIHFNEFGVLVRTNSLTRSIEEAFLRNNVPYRVSGGMSFFERKEVKDILSYMKIISNSDDDVNILRIINVPRRGIGKKTIEQVMKTAKKDNCSIYSAITTILNEKDSTLPQKMKDELKDFISIFEYFRERFFSKNKMADTLKALVDHINYWEYLLQEHKKPNVARWKYLNVEGLINSIADYENDPDVIDPTLFSYLNRITVLTRDNNENNDEIEKVNVMTIHSAKGLEFDAVFIAGTEDTIIPHAKSVEENDSNLEEERRLFYVAITRAKKILSITACKQRRKKGALIDVVMSPFIDELPKDLINFISVDEVVGEDEADKLFEKIHEKMGIPSKKEA